MVTYLGLNTAISSKNRILPDAAVSPPSPLSYLKYGINLTGNTKYNTFVNCVGESFGSNSLRHGIWFSFSSAACSATNTFTNFTTRSALAATSTDLAAETYLNVGDSITAGGAAGLPYGAYIHYTNITLGNGYVFYNKPVLSTKVLFEESVSHIPLPPVLEFVYPIEARTVLLFDVVKERP
jgi:hypothetical protein